MSGGHLNPTDRMRLFHESSQIISLEAGPQYQDCTEDDIEAYTAYFGPYTFGSKMSPSISAKDFEESLNIKRWPSLLQKQALDRIKMARWNASSHPATVIKAAHDIDVALFGGKFRYRLRIFWYEPATNPNSQNFGTAFGFMKPQADGTCHIYLNRDTILRKRSQCGDQMWWTQIHEMVVSRGQSPSSD